MIGTLIDTLLAPIASTPAWADHPGALRSPGMNPVVAALLWAGAAFLVGVAIVAIVTVLGRRRRPRSPDA